MSGAYYPSILVTMRIRFDEVFAPLLDLELTEQPTSQQLMDARSFDNVSGQRKSILPLLMSDVKDSLSRVFNLQPKNADVVLESYRRSGTFSLEFDYARIPVDPRLIRSAAVEIYLDSVPAQEFADGMEKRTPSGVASKQPRLATLVPDPQRNLLFVGVVDEWETQHDEAGSWARIEGRDLRSIFLDSPADTALFENLDVSKPIDDVVRQILARHPMGEAFRDAVKAVEWPRGKVPSPYTKDGVTRVRRPADTNSTATGKVRAVPKSDPNQINFWDLITQYCFLCGAIPYFQGPELRIRPIRPLYDTIDKAGFDPNVATPFKFGFPRDVKESDPAVQIPFAIRKMVMGRNVSKVRMKRRFNTFKPRIIECVSLNTSSRERGAAKLLIAGWDGFQDPYDDGTGIGLVKKRNNQHHKPRYFKTKIAPSGFRSEAEVLRVSVPGITDVQQLRDIAQAIFHEIGRGEIAGSAETSDLASYAPMPGDGGNGDPDMLILRPGDPIEFLTDTSAFNPDKAPIVHELIEQVRLGYEHAVKRIAHQMGGAEPSIGDWNMARVLAASARKLADLQSYFRVQTVRYGFRDDGLAVSFDFQNFIEARFDTARAGVAAGREGGIGPFPQPASDTPTTPQPTTPHANLRKELLATVRKAGQVQRKAVERAIPRAPANSTRMQASAMSPQEREEQDLRDRANGGFKWEYDDFVQRSRSGEDSRD